MHFTQEAYCGSIVVRRRTNNADEDVHHIHHISGSVLNIFVIIHSYQWDIMIWLKA